MNLVKSQDGQDVADTVAESDKKVELESIRINEVQPIRHPNPPGPPSVPPQHHAQHQQPGRPPVRQFNGGRPRQPGPPSPQRRPSGFLGALRGRFPFLF